MNIVILVMTIAVSAFAYALIAFAVGHSAYKVYTKECNLCEVDRESDSEYKECWRDHDISSIFTGAFWPLAAVAAMTLGIIYVAWIVVEYILKIPNNMGKRLSDWVMP